METKNTAQPPGAANEDINQALGSLRQEIDAIDEQIVSHLAKRQAVVERVVALKKKHKLPIYHPAREEDLISMRRNQGKESGLNPDYIEELYRSVLHQSRAEQAGHMSLKGIRPGASVLILGGRGGMGRYFRHWFEDTGYEVRIMGRDGWSTIAQLCKGVDLAMLSVPIEVTGEIANRLGPYLHSDTILCDITSVKEKPLKGMLDAHPGPVVGLHPLFGPTTSTMDKQIIVATPGRDPEACQWLLDQFSAWGSIVVSSSAREHDEIMGIVQALRHFATFAFGQFLSRRKVDIQRTLEFSSPIYRLELGMVGRLFAQDSSLYSEIIFASPQRRALLKEYLASLGANLEMLEKGDKTYFQKEFTRIAEWFGPFSEQAMRESTFLIDKLIERF
ncbi:MAG: bifunctional chorismate mutase/prephenate dehydrogenase [Desulfobacteraceae bacterium]|nr:bifunctional chorismate mutase/prephenate dehydrogenase [Desulfobacteraceae bacterium]